MLAKQIRHVWIFNWHLAIRIDDSMCSTRSTPLVMIWPSRYRSQVAEETQLALLGQHIQGPYHPQGPSGDLT